MALCINNNNKHKLSTYTQHLYLLYTVFSTESNTGMISFAVGRADGADCQQCSISLINDCGVCGGIVGRTPDSIRSSNAEVNWKLYSEKGLCRAEEENSHSTIPNE